jgi:hypothetical protein
VIALVAMCTFSILDLAPSMTLRMERRMQVSEPTWSGFGSNRGKHVNGKFSGLVGIPPKG